MRSSDHHQRLYKLGDGEFFFFSGRACAAAVSHQLRWVRGSFSREPAPDFLITPGDFPPLLHDSIRKVLAAGSFMGMHGFGGRWGIGRKCERERCTDVGFMRGEWLNAIRGVTVMDDDLPGDWAVARACPWPRRGRGPWSGRSPVPRRRSTGLSIIGSWNENESFAVVLYACGSEWNSL